MFLCLLEKTLDPYITILMLIQKFLGFQAEINPGNWCQDAAEPLEYQNICDGPKNDCELKGKVKCRSDPNCHGIMLSPSWSPSHKGVMMCKSAVLVEKPGENWSIFLKSATCPYNYVPSFTDGRTCVGITESEVELEKAMCESELDELRSPLVNLNPEIIDTISDNM